MRNAMSPRSRGVMVDNALGDYTSAAALALSVETSPGPAARIPNRLRQTMKCSFANASTFSALIFPLDGVHRLGLVLTIIARQL
jgi:hypothetical protein